MNYAEMIDQVKTELKKLDTIQNFVTAYKRQLLYPERFAILVAGLFEEKEDDESNSTPN